MHKPDKAPEPSMEEILASIRKIIAEEPVGSRPGLSRDADEDEPSTSLPPSASDDEGPDGPSYSVEDALADLMDDAPQRRTVRGGEREAARESAPKPHGQPAFPSENAGHRPSWLFGRASDSQPVQQQRAIEPEAPHRPAGSLRGQLDSLRSAPERDTDDRNTAAATPGPDRNAGDTGPLIDPKRAAGPSGLASFPTPPPAQTQDLPRPAAQRVPTRDLGPGLPDERTGADVRASKPVVPSGASEAPPPASRVSELAPGAGPQAGASRIGPSAGQAAAPVVQPEPAKQREDDKERDSKPVSPAITGSGQPRETQPRSEVPQTAAPSAARPSVPRSGAASSSGEESPAARTLEETVAELLRPMLREWLDANMPRIVEKALRVELETRAKRPGADGSR